MASKITPEKAWEGIGKHLSALHGFAVSIGCDTIAFTMSDFQRSGDFHFEFLDSAGDLIDPDKDGETPRGRIDLGYVVRSKLAVDGTESYELDAYRGSPLRPSEATMLVFAELHDFLSTSGAINAACNGLDFEVDPETGSFTLHIDRVDTARWGNFHPGCASPVGAASGLEHLASARRHLLAALRSEDCGLAHDQRASFEKQMGEFLAAVGQACAPQPAAGWSRHATRIASDLFDGENGAGGSHVEATVWCREDLDPAEAVIGFWRANEVGLEALIDLRPWLAEADRGEIQSVLNGDWTSTMKVLQCLSEIDEPSIIEFYAQAKGQAVTMDFGVADTDFLLAWLSRYRPSIHEGPRPEMMN